MSSPIGGKIRSHTIDALFNGFMSYPAYASRLSIVQSRVDVSKDSSYRELPVVTEKRYISFRPSLVFHVYVISLISKSLPAQRNLTGLIRYGMPKEAMTLMPSFSCT